MTQADSVHSTPPTNTPMDTTRRHLLTVAAGAAVAAAIPAAAMAAAPAPDPIFAAIAVFRGVEFEYMTFEGDDIPDELGDRHSDAYYAVLRIRPTTMAGLVELTALVRERADYLCPHSLMSGEELCAITAAINDAARGMSRLGKAVV
jgi:hypothetical protein